MDWSFVGDILGNIASGGLLGIIGSISTGIMRLKEMKLRMEERAADRAHDLAMITAEADASVRLERVETEGEVEKAEIETKGKVELAEVNAYALSQRVGNKDALSSSVYQSMLERDDWISYIGGFVIMLLGIGDAFRRFMRPGLTCFFAWKYQVLMATIVTGDVFIQAATGKDDLYLYVVQSTIFIASSCFFWWFADRRMEKNTADLAKQTFGR